MINPPLLLCKEGDADEEEEEEEDKEDEEDEEEEEDDDDDGDVRATVACSSSIALRSSTRTEATLPRGRRRRS